MKEVNANCLVIIFGEKIEALYFPSCPDSFSDTSGHTYKRVFSVDDNGFFDWMRCVSGKIVGIRWIPYEDVILRDKRLRQLKQFRNIVLDDNFTELTVYFRSDQIVDEKNSCDQNFGENNLFFSKEGRCAGSFSISMLSDEERNSLPS